MSYRKLSSLRYLLIFTIGITVGTIQLFTFLSSSLCAQEITTTTQETIPPTETQPATTQPASKDDATPSTAPSTTTPISVPLALPAPIGTILLEGTIDISTQKFSMAASFAKKPTIDIGILRLSNPKASFSSAQGLQIKAEFSLFDVINGTLGLEELKIGQYVVFSLKLNKPISLPLSPWKPIELDSLYLYLSPTQQKLYTTCSVVKKSKGKEITVTFGLEKKNHFAELDIESIALKDLVSDLQSSPVGGITLEKASFKITNALNPKAERIVSIKSLVNLESLSSAFPPQFNVNLKNLETNLTIDDKKGLYLSAKLAAQLPLIPSFCYIKNPEFNLVKAFKPTTTKTAPVQTIIEKDEALAALNIATKDLAQEATQSTMPIVTLKGEVDFILPSNLGTAQVALVSKFQFNKFGSFEGTVTSDLSFFDAFSLKNAHFLLAVEKTKGKAADASLTAFKAEISTKAIILGIDTKAKVIVEREKTTKKYGFTFSGSIAEDAPAKPFEKTNIPILQDVTLANISIGFDLISKSFFLQGQTTVLNIPVQGRVVKNPQALYLTASIGKGWRLSQTVPEAKGTFLDDLDFADSKLILSTAAYKDTTLNIDIKKGVNLISNTPLSSPAFKNLRTLLGNTGPDQLMIAGSMGTSLSDISLTAIVPFAITMGPQLKLNNASIRIDGAGPSLSLYAQMEVKPRLKDKPLVFTGKLALSTVGASGSATMAGMWEKPLDIPIPNLAIGDLALELGIDYKAFAATRLPTVFGITGALDIGKAKARVGLKITTNVQELIIHGSLSRLSLADIIEFSQQVGIPLPQGIDIPNLKMEDMEFHLAPTGGKIGEIAFEPGLTMKGRVEILEKFAWMNLHVGTDGLMAEGSMSDFELGPLLITGRGLIKGGIVAADAGKEMTEKNLATLDPTFPKGPAVSLMITLQKQHLYVSGLMKFLDFASSETEIYLDTKGFKLFTQTKMANLFDVQLTGQSVGSGKKLDITFDGYFKNDFNKYLIRAVGQAFNQAQAKTIKDLTDAQDKVKNMNTEIAKVETQLKAKEAEIAKLEDTVRKKTKEAQEKMGETLIKLGQKESEVKALQNNQEQMRQAFKRQTKQVVAKLEEAQKNVDKLDNDANNIQKQIATARKNFQNWWKVPGLGTAYAVIKAAQFIAKNTLEGIKQISQASQTTLTMTEGVLADPSSWKETGDVIKASAEKNTLLAAKTAMVTSRDAALEALELVKQVSLSAGDIAKKVTQEGLAFISVATQDGKGFIQIKKASIKFSARALIAGKLPLINLEFIGKSGQPLKPISLQIDFKNPNQGIEKITQMLIELSKA